MTTSHPPTSITTLPVHIPEPAPASFQGVRSLVNHFEALSQQAPIPRITATIAPPVAHPVTSPAIHPTTTTVAHPISAPVAHPIAAPVTHPVATPATHPTTAPIAHPGAIPHEPLALPKETPVLAPALEPHPVAMPNVAQAPHQPMPNAVPIELSRFPGASPASSAAYLAKEHPVPAGLFPDVKSLAAKFDGLAQPASGAKPTSVVSTPAHQVASSVHTVSESHVSAGGIRSAETSQHLPTEPRSAETTHVAIPVAGPTSMPEAHVVAQPAGLPASVRDAAYLPQPGAQETTDGLSPFRTLGDAEFRETFATPAEVRVEMPSFQVLGVPLFTSLQDDVRKTSLELKTSIEHHSGTGNGLEQGAIDKLNQTYMERLALEKHVLDQFLKVDPALASLPEFRALTGRTLDVVGEHNARFEELASRLAQDHPLPQQAMNEVATSLHQDTMALTGKLTNILLQAHENFDLD